MSLTQEALRSASAARAAGVRLPRPRVVLSSLLVAALLLHELGYLLARGACGADGGLALSVTIGVALIVAAGWSLALIPLLSRLPQARRGLSLALVIAVALLTIFLSQEAVESLVLDDKAAIAQAALGILAPLSLLLGALAAHLARSLYRAAAALVSAAGGTEHHQRRTRRAHGHCHPYSLECGPAITAAPLAFRLACRPPPAAAQA